AAAERIATVTEIVDIAHRPAVQSVSAVVEVRLEEPALAVRGELDLGVHRVERRQEETLAGEWQQSPGKCQEPREHLWALKEHERGAVFRGGLALQSFGASG